MAKPLREYTPVKAKRGALVHATCMSDPGKTSCGVRCDGWRVEPDALDCPKCLEKIFGHGTRKVVR